jgi:hypothetical protein
MPDRGEFRATTDQLIDILERLRAIEDQKRAARLGTREFVEHAQRAVDVGRLVYRWTEMQLAMAHEAARRLDAGELDPDIRLIEVVPRPMDRILAQWREAQLRLEIAKPGSDEALLAAEAMDRLREEYAGADWARNDAARRFGMVPGFVDPDERTHQGDQADPETTR